MTNQERQAKALQRYSQLQKKSKQELLDLFGQYHRIHSADTGTPKGDLIAGILEVEGLTA